MELNFGSKVVQRTPPRQEFKKAFVLALSAQLAQQKYN